MIKLVCAHCQSGYLRYPSETLKSRFCSRKCQNAVLLKLAVESRKVKARTARGDRRANDTIFLPGGLKTLVDCQDIDLDDILWSLDARTGYVKHGGAYLHRVILERIVGRGLKRGEFCDHVNGDRLDNRRSNLRIASKVDNNRNSRLRKDNRLGLKGVHLDDGRYVTRVCGARIGAFSTAEDAAYVYDQVAIQLFGGFARTNFDLTCEYPQNA